MPVDLRANAGNDEGRLAEIKNRIIGSGEEPLDNILFNPRNWRIHPLNQQNALKGVLDEVGWVQEVIINKRTGHLVDGHLRCQLAAREGAKTIPVKYVDLSEDEEVLVLATLDPIAAMAGSDKEKLRALLEGVKSDDERVQALLDEIARGAGLTDDDVYTRKIEIPTYDPSGRKPELSELCDTTKAEELIAEIDATDLPEGEKEFLRKAATRHFVFGFDKIADYYAHSSPEVQRLMENSALVLIDFDRAIELGYVVLTKKIAELSALDYEDDGDGDEE